MGALQLVSAAFSAAIIIRKIYWTYSLWCSVLLAACCIWSFIIYIRKAHYFMNFGNGLS